MAEKHAGGRPPAYKSASEMQILIDKYFLDCEGILYKDMDGEVAFDKYGKPIILGAKPLTITGLALALGFNSRLSLLNYQDKDEFVNTVTRAKAKVEAYAEARLYDRDGSNGAKFSLANNFKDWREKRETEFTGKDGGPIELFNLSPEERQQRIESLLQKRLSN